MDFVKITIIDRETVITKELLDSFQDGIVEAITKAEAALNATPANGALLETITQEKVDKWDSAQPNVIEKIFVNGAELPVDEKAVSILIPTKASDVGAAEADHDHDGIYLKSNEMIPAALIPIASETECGAVKSSIGDNQVTVSTDGTMRVDTISTSSLRVPSGESFVLVGGDADDSYL